MSGPQSTFKNGLPSIQKFAHPRPADADIFKTLHIQACSWHVSAIFS